MKINKKRLCEIRTAVDNMLVTAGYMNVDAGKISGAEEENVGTPVIDIIKIAHAYGFVVGDASFADNILGFIIVNENTSLFTDCNITLAFSNHGSSIDRINRINQLICINNSMKPQRKRFIIAYELGYYILYFDAGADGGWAHVDRPGRPEGEMKEVREADAFAKYLLMSEGSFTAKYQQIKNAGLREDEIYLLIARKYNVTETLAEQRAKYII